MNGARRVVTFCLLTAVLPTILLIIPLYLRHSVYADVTYAVAESDVLEVIDGISTVFCQEQILRMNTSFRAFQLRQMPPLSSEKKYIHLKKGMSLPDDTLEYWGFYLLKGSVVLLSACSRYEGARVLVVKGEKNLRTCGLRDHPRKYISQDKGIGNMKAFTHDPQIIKQKLYQEEKIVKKPEVLSTTWSSKETNIEDPVTEKFVDVKDIGNDDHKFTADATLKNNFTDKEIKLQHVQSSDTQPTKFRHQRKRLKTPSGLGTTYVTRNQSVKYPITRNDSVLSDHDLKLAKETLQKELENDDDNYRVKRDASIHQGIVLDAAVGHGTNITENPGLESSESSFEINLRECYDGQELFTEHIAPTPDCSHHHINNGSSIIKKTEISSDGYYYFIFYSDNEIQSNPIFANFDIYKTTYQSTNYSRGCLNQTECKFPLTFWSNEVVIVEIPTYDGIEHDEKNDSYLISTCYPRMSVYVSFPIAVLLLILGCAFL